MSRLFQPLQIGPVTAPNRIAIAPMCQYSAEDGCAVDWHLQHVMNLAMSGAGLVVLEATAVERRGRITHGCLGLYSDANEAALARVVAAARRVAAPGALIGVQIAHAGRKGSAQRPWEGGGQLGPEQDPWTTVAPSALPFDEGWSTPAAFDDEAADRIVAAFVQAAQRASRIGFDVVELHMAHGYFLHETLSPLTNTRADRWGGSPEARRSLALAVTLAVRAALPASVALGARITGQDWIEGGLTVADAVTLAGALKKAGVDYCDVSSGGIAPGARIKVEPGYQVPFARSVKEGSGIVTRAVGMIVDPLQAEQIIESGAADQIAIARAVLDDPRWPWHAADALGAVSHRPPQYARASAKAWPGAALLRRPAQPATLRDAS